MIGKTIFNYKIIEKIGEGGMGVVYKAVDINLDRTVAIKVLHKEYSENQNLIERFKVEAKVQAKLIHPNICTLFTMFEHEKNLFMVMEYIEGVNLSDIINQRGKIEVTQAVPLFLQVLKGINVAHKAGIIHRDIKPSNIIINNKGVVKVMDFGIAKIKGATKLTKTGFHVGTIYYMSPEQIKGQEVDNRSDIYSLGITFYEILTGVSPFTGNTEFEIMEAHVKKKPAPPSQIDKSIPPGLDKIILKAIEKNPDKRYATAEQFFADLKRFYDLSKTRLDKTVVDSNIVSRKTAIDNATIVDGFSQPTSFLSKNKKKILIFSGIAIAFITLFTILLVLSLSRNSNRNKNIALLSDGSNTVVTPSDASNNRSGIGPQRPVAPIQKSNNHASNAAIESIAKDVAKKIASKKKSGASGTNKKKKKNPLAKKHPAPPPPEKETPIENNNPAIPNPPEQSNNTTQIGQVLTNLENALDNGNIFTPPGQNAIYYYIIAHKIASDNQRLAQLKSDLVEEIKIALDTAIAGGKYQEAENIFNIFRRVFPYDSSVPEYSAKIENIKETAKALAGARLFYVAHDHSGDFSRYCVGILYIKQGIVGFKTQQSNDGRKDDFEVHFYSIKEFKKNIWPVGNYYCFHIKLKNGKNYNFALLNQNGQNMDPAIVVSYFNNLK